MTHNPSPINSPIHLRENLPAVGVGWQEASGKVFLQQPWLHSVIFALCFHPGTGLFLGGSSHFVASIPLHKLGVGG